MEQYSCWLHSNVFPRDSAFLLSPYLCVSEEPWLYSTAPLILMVASALPGTGKHPMALASFHSVVTFSKKSSHPASTCRPRLSLCFSFHTSLSRGSYVTFLCAESSGTFCGSVAFWTISNLAHSFLCTFILCLFCLLWQFLAFMLLNQAIAFSKLPRANP